MGLFQYQLIHIKKLLIIFYRYMGETGVESRKSILDEGITGFQLPPPPLKYNYCLRFRWLMNYLIQYIVAASLLMFVWCFQMRINYQTTFYRAGFLGLTPTPYFVSPNLLPDLKFSWSSIGRFNSARHQQGKRTIYTYHG